VSLAIFVGRMFSIIIPANGSLFRSTDAALGGGYPKGRVVEIYGPESSGKTTLALHAIAECQKAGGTAAFVDAEHALDPSYAANMGVDIDDLLISQPDSGEMALDIVDKLVRSAAVDVIVVDSVAALVPRAELEGEMSDSQIGLQARLMSKAMRKITGSLNLSQCTVIFINQLRSKVRIQLHPIFVPAYVKTHMMPCFSGRRHLWISRGNFGRKCPQVLCISSSRYPKKRNSPRQLWNPSQGEGCQEQDCCTLQSSQF
jgi:Ni2+-binding GTPase involved in maturation of urease and hydrogenase